MKWKLWRTNPYSSKKVTILILAGCAGPIDEYNSFTAKQDPETGEIHVEWDLLNGVSGELRRTFFLAGLSILIPEINGELILVKNDDGQYELVYLNRDPYPSIEIYVYKDGKWILARAVDMRRYFDTGWDERVNRNIFRNIFRFSV